MTVIRDTFSVPSRLKQLHDVESPLATTDPAAAAIVPNSTTAATAPMRNATPDDIATSTPSSLNTRIQAAGSAR